MTDQSALVTEQCWKYFRDRNKKEEAEKVLEQVKEPPQSMRDEEDDEYYNCTLLHYAALWGWLSVVIKLVENYLCDPMCTDDDGNTPLRFACEGSHLDVIKYLITECKCDPIDTNHNGNTLLHSACRGGHLDVIKYLITECKCDPMDTNHKGNTLLHSACEGGHLDVIKYLITECKCDPMDTNRKGNTLLHSACKGGHLDVIKYLITECKCDPKCTCDNGDTLLHCACLGGHLDVIKYLITECECDASCTNYSGETLLHHACMDNGKLEVVQYLITDCKCDPFCTDNVLSTPLFLACTDNNLDIAQYLVTVCGCNPMDSCDELIHTTCFYNVDLNFIQFLMTEGKCDPMCANDDGNTPLHNACEAGNLDVVKYLITECKCDPMCTNDYGNTPLQNACEADNLDVVKYLITECKCDPMCTDDDGNTPLHSACEADNLDVVKYLITECKCDPMCTDDDGNTPLHSACEADNLDVIKYLITECKCYPMCTNEYGNTPLQSACKADNLDVIKYLITECKCDPKCTKSHDGDTLLHIACYNDYLDVIQYLITECKLDPLCPNKSLKTPVDIAAAQNKSRAFKYFFLTGVVSSSVLFKQYSTKDHIHDLVIKLHSCVSVNSFVNIFLLGNSGAGKSTLTKVINMRANGALWFGQYRSISNIELLTAGVIPHTLKHKEFGNIIMHDLAGQPEYYSSHSAIIENILNGSSAVFIIVAKLSDDPPYKWLSLVKDLCTKCSSVCYLLTVASHADAIINESERLQLTQRLNSEVQHYAANEERVYNSGIVYLDCRKLDGQQFTVFRDSLSHACQSIQRNSYSQLDFPFGQEMMPFCRMLYSFFQSESESVYSLHELYRVVKMASEDYYLPKTAAKLSEVLRYLHRTGLIMFIETQRRSWVVTNKESLLAEVNGIIFSPKSFKIHHNFANNTGQLYVWL